MSKMKLAVIFGGMSTEHDVSIVSGTAVISNLDKLKYEIFPIYIDKDGEWYEYKEKNIEMLKIGEDIKDKEKISNPIEYLKKLDCVFPVLHGLYGEDGTIQGLLELIKKPYVGCKVLASSICMDKVYTKIVFEKAKIEQANYIYIRQYNGKYIYVDKEFSEKQLELEEITNLIDEKIKYPMFVKPSNSGSSVGVSKAENMEELEKAIINAQKYDREILIEEGICGREVECAVLGNEEVVSSCVGEVLASGNFYSFDSKYKSKESKTVIPAKLDESIEKKIRELAIKAYKAVGGRGLSRVDFFVENKTNRIIINEINTLPGFTNISMYPKLFEAVGIKYSDLLDKLIELAMEEK